MKEGILRARAASSTGNPFPIKWEEVTGLTTEGAIAVVLDNGETVEGIAKTLNAGSLQLSSETSEVPFSIPLILVKAIYTSPGELPTAEDNGQIIMKNGDRITGEILSLENEKLKVKTSYAEVLTITWTDVQSLTSPTPLAVEVFDGDGEIDDEEFGTTTHLNVRSLEETERLSLARIKTINIPELRYKGIFDLGGNRLTGNTNTTALNASAESEAWTDRHRVYFNGKYNFAQADGEDTANNARGTFEYDYFFTKKLYGGLREFLEQDQFQGLAIRSTTVAAIGYEFFDKTGHKLRGAIGPGAVYEKFQELKAIFTPTTAWSLKWEYDLMTDQVELFHRQQGFRDLGGGGSNAIRWVAEQGVRLTFGKLYLKLEFDYRFNSEPEPGRKESDESFIWGVGYKFAN